MTKNKNTYTAFLVRDTNKRQYLNADSPRGGRWSSFNEASVFHREDQATRVAFGINNSRGTDNAQVVPVTLFKRG